MNFFEHSARVPPSLSWSRRHGRSRVRKPCSLVDILPTMLDVAALEAGRKDPSPASRLMAVRSGTMAASGEEVKVQAIGENTAPEMTADPVIMIRRGRYKYIHCDSDAPLLYDIEADPMEKHNLTDDPAHADLAAAFAAEIAEGWNMPVVKADVALNKSSVRRSMPQCNQGRGQTGNCNHPQYTPKNMCAITWTGPKPRQKRAIRRWLTDHHQDR